MTTAQTAAAQEPLTLRRVVQTWWPLAGSWALMTLEGPAQSAVGARLPDAETNLAAWGGIVFPITMVVAAPVIMLLSAANALVTDLATYDKVRRFMMVLGLTLTLLHVGIAATPLYDVIAGRLIGAPDVTIARGRLGLIIMTPWALAIAYRRFHQGVMIRFGHSKAVAIGTVIRLATNVVMLGIGYVRGASGIVVGTSAVAAGVIAEAVYAGLRALPIVRKEVPRRANPQTTLTLRGLLAFYIPLVLTSLLSIVVEPIVSAAMSRMPNALASLAAWPVLNGLIFLLRSPAFAFNEVVVALAGKPGASHTLRRFTIALTGLSLVLTLLFTATPLATVWFQGLMALPQGLLNLSSDALWLALLLPAQIVLLSWHQGRLVQAKETRAITEAFAVYLIGMTLILGLGVRLQALPGLAMTVIAFEIAGAAQVGWLWRRAHQLVDARTSEQR
ncbi:MAG: hypothetical protein ACP5HG_12760 [Anaerolineae bacterium]